MEATSTDNAHSIGPQSIIGQSPIIGQPLALQYLRAGLIRQRLSPAYCFAGPSGVGRALATRWFLRALFCPERQATGGSDPCDRCNTCRRIQQGNHPDVLWMEPTYRHQNRSIPVSEAIELGLKRKSPPQVRLETIRQISEFTSRAPLESDRSVVVIEGAETLAEAAANALLKTLEEPQNSRLILIASDAAALLQTIISRCQLIPFQRLSSSQTAEILQQQGHSDIDPTILSLSQGSPGQALEAITYADELPIELIQQLKYWPRTYQQALSIGRTVSKELDVPTQLWFVDYLQHQFWHLSPTQTAPQLTDSPPPLIILERLETLRRHLKAFVQPQLSWEIALSPIKPINC